MKKIKKLILFLILNFIFTVKYTYRNAIQTLWLKEDHQLDIKNLITLKKDKEELEIQNIELNAKISSLEEEVSNCKVLLHKFVGKIRIVNFKEFNFAL